MTLEIREPRTPEEMEQIIGLQMSVGGLPERHVTSPITLCTLMCDHPRTGWVLAAFQDGRVVGFSIGLATADPGAAYLFMLAVDPDSQGARTGEILSRRQLERIRAAGKTRVYWTYEPLEAKNAHIYLNKMGARAVSYKQDFYYLNTGLHAGMPQDRFLVELDLDAMAGAAPPDLDRALARLPLATARELPEAPEVLVEIPGRIHALLEADPDAALARRMETRGIFGHYVSGLGYHGAALLRGHGPDESAFYLLREKNPRP